MNRPQTPLYEPTELAHLFPTDHRHAYDIRQVVARVVDGSLVHEFLPNSGREILRQWFESLDCGLALRRMFKNRNRIHIGRA